MAKKTWTAMCVLAALFGLFGASAARSSNGSYPETLPEGFTNTPYQAICQTDTKRQAYEKYYAVVTKDPEVAMDFIMILGHDGVDIAIFHLRATRDDKRAEAYTAGANGWKEDGALAAGFAANGRMQIQMLQNYTDAEAQQIETCLQQKKMY